MNALPCERQDERREDLKDKTEYRIIAASKERQKEGAILASKIRTVELGL
jgi:hypothetical protein